MCGGGKCVDIKYLQQILSLPDYLFGILQLFALPPTFISSWPGVED